MYNFAKNFYKEIFRVFSFNARSSSFICFFGEQRRELTHPGLVFFFPFIVVVVRSLRMCVKDIAFARRVALYTLTAGCPFSSKTQANMQHLEPPCLPMQPALSRGDAIRRHPIL